MTVAEIFSRRPTEPSPAAKFRFGDSPLARLLRVGPLRRATHDNRASNLESTIQFCVIVSYARRLVKAFLENAMTKKSKMRCPAQNAGEISCFNVRARATGGRPERCGVFRGHVCDDCHAGDGWSPLQKVIIFSPGFVFAEAMTIRAGYGKLFSLIGENVCLPDVFSQNAKISLLFYLR